MRGARERRGLVCFSGNGHQDRVYLGSAPYWWSYTAEGRRWRPGQMDDVIRVFREGVAGFRNGRPA